MKKQHIFLIELGIILYLFYLIIDFSYKEYRINSSIEYISELNTNIRDTIDKTTALIDYKSSLAYKNKILKEQQSLKNKGEQVLYVTSEEKFNKYTKIIPTNTVDTQIAIDPIQEDTKHLSVYEKWMYFIQRQ